MLKMTQLIGFGAKQESAAAPLTTVSFLASSTSVDSETITLPASIAAGDLIIVLDAISNDSSPTLVTPSGFTNVTNATSSYMRFASCYKIADGSEASTSVTGLLPDPPGGGAKIAAVFRGDVAISSFTPASINQPSIDNANPTAQSVTASGGTPPLIVFGFYVNDYGSGVNPRTFSPTKDGEINESGATYCDLWLAYKIYNSSPANVTVDMDDEGYGNGIQSYYGAMT